MPDRRSKDRIDPEFSPRRASGSRPVAHASRRPYWHSACSSGCSASSSIALAPMLGERGGSRLCQRRWLARRDHPARHGKAACTMRAGASGGRSKRCSRARPKLRRRPSIGGSLPDLQSHLFCGILRQRVSGSGECSRRSWSEVPQRSSCRAQAMLHPWEQADLEVTNGRDAAGRLSKGARRRERGAIGGYDAGRTASPVASLTGTEPVAALLLIPGDLDRGRRQLLHPFQRRPFRRSFARAPQDATRAEKTRSGRGGQSSAASASVRAVKQTPSSHSISKGRTSAGLVGRALSCNAFF